MHECDDPAICPVCQRGDDGMYIPPTSIYKNSFPALYPGKCALCPHYFGEGEYIYKCREHEGYAHKGCEE